MDELKPLTPTHRIRCSEATPSAVAALELRWASGDDGIEREGDAFRISPAVAWDLPDAVLAGLGLQRLQAPVRLHTAGGIPGGARYRWTLTWPADTTLDGPGLLRGTARIVVPPALLDLPALVESAAGASKATVYRTLRHVQQIAASTPLLALGDRLKRVKIREATQIRIDVAGKKEAPNLKVQLVGPAPGATAAGDDAASSGTARPDWEAEVGAEEAQALVAVAVPEWALLQNWVARVTQDTVVKLGRDEVVLVTKEVCQNFVLMKAAAEQPPDVRAQFVQNPLAFLPAPSAFDEADYSARVVGVGEAPRSSSRDAAEARSWADPSEGLLIELPSGPVWVTPDELPTLAADLQAGLAAGKTSVSFQGAEIPCTPAVASAVAQAASPPGDPPGDEEPEEGKTGRPTVLRIQENDAVLDWAPLRAGGRHAPAPALPELAEGVQLKPHQKVALAHLRNRWSRGEAGALLCDDMGLGKTMQALAFAAWVDDQLQRGGGAREGDTDTVTLPVMVVGPPSLLEGWLAEIGRRLPPDRFPRVLWGAGSRPANHHGRTVELLKNFRDDAPKTGEFSAVLQHARLNLAAIQAYAPSVLFIGYDALRTLQFAVGALRVGLVIADEAQQVKNPSSLRSHALRAMNYDFALALTGTPIENSWTDLWTLCDFATPGLLGPLSAFREAYPASGDTRETGLKLAQTVREALIRRTRANALSDLPPCSIRSVERPMGADQALAYRAEVTRHQGGGRAVLGLLQGLARTSLHPRVRAVLNTPEEARAWLQDSARTHVLLESLEAWSQTGEAVLVFVRSKAAQATLKRALELAFGLPDVGVLNGDLTLPKRQQLVLEFELDEGFRVLLVSPDVGGAGWNLQFAARSFLLERPFNPAIEAQMIARTWRLGQTRPVEVVAPVAVLDGMTSFDEVLDQLLCDKRELAESVLAPAVVESKELESRFGQLLGRG